ncbi:MAG: Slp family lipoprotein [Steroidobacteraceae bacterium]
MNKHLLIALAAAGLASCATVPTPLQGQFSAITPRAATTEASAVHGEAVRWGGQIIEATPKSDSTCFEILGRKLDSIARPDYGQDAADGRFIACRSGFYDPEVFASGRDITVVGHVTGIDHGKVGDFDYAYPHVAADAIYLWPKPARFARSPYYDPWQYGPYGFGWGAYWGPYWGPYFGGGRVIIRHPNPPPPPQSSH